MLKGKDVQRVVFYEITKRAVSEAIAAAARPVARPGQRAAGAPRARLPGRLQSVAAAVEEGAARPVRRPRAEPGAAHDRASARRRSKPSSPQEYWTHRSRRRAHRADASPLKLIEVRRQEGRAVHRHRRRHAREAARKRINEAAQGVAARHRPSTSKQRKRRPVAAVHHLHAAAGSRAQARLHRPAHHAAGAAAV